MEDFVSSSKAQEFYKVSEQTLRDWANSNKINYITTEGGHRRYRIFKERKENRRKIIYARVSSKKQENETIKKHTQKTNSSFSKPSINPRFKR